jgi:hypothetical protein
MISNDTVNNAIFAARHELTNTAELSWIKESALTERAYYMGLYFGLSGIAEKEILDTLLLKTILGTMWQRKADDTFAATSIGREYGKLKNILQSGEPPDSDFRNTTESLQHDIERHDQKWQSIFRQAQEVMNEIIQVSSIEKEAEDEMDNGYQNSIFGNTKKGLHRISCLNLC